MGPRQHSHAQQVVWHNTAYAHTTKSTFRLVKAQCIAVECLRALSTISLMCIACDNSLDTKIPKLKLILKYKLQRITYEDQWQKTPGRLITMVIKATQRKNLQSKTEGAKHPFEGQFAPLFPCGIVSGTAHMIKSHRIIEKIELISALRKV